MKSSHVNFSLSLLAFIAFPTFALESDTRQPIDVLSNQQSLDLENNQAVFEENVVITQGSIQIKANKVIVNRPKDKTRSETLDAFGTPVYFQQTLDDGKLVQGEGQKVHYDISRELIILVEKAKLHQAESQIEGKEITYDVKKQQLKANGSQQKRVRTILIPSQLDKNNKNTSLSIQTIEKPTQFNAHAPLTQTEGIKALQRNRQAQQK